MFLAKVKSSITSTQKHPAYAAKKVFVVQHIAPDGKELAEECVAVDCVGAGCGSVVVCGSSPGVAKGIFDIDRAPIRTLIIAIVDRVVFQDL